MPFWKNRNPTEREIEEAKARIAARKRQLHEEQTFGHVRRPEFPRLSKYGPMTAAVAVITTYLIFSPVSPQKTQTANPNAVFIPAVQETGEEEKEVVVAALATEKPSVAVQEVAQEADAQADTEDTKKEEPLVQAPLKQARTNFSSWSVGQSEKFFVAPTTVYTRACSSKAVNPCLSVVLDSITKVDEKQIKITLRFTSGLKTEFLPGRMTNRTKNDGFLFSYNDMQDRIGTLRVGMTLRAGAGIYRPNGKVTTSGMKVSKPSRRHFLGIDFGKTGTADFYFPVPVGSPRNLTLTFHNYNNSNSTFEYRMFLPS